MCVCVRACVRACVCCVVLCCVVLCCVVLCCVVLCCVVWGECACVIFIRRVQMGVDTNKLVSIINILPFEDKTTPPQVLHQVDVINSINSCFRV